jgi:hypothetical protein
MVIRSPGSPLIHSTRAVERQWVIVQPSHQALQWSSGSRSGSSHAIPAQPLSAGWSPELQEPERLVPVALPEADAAAQPSLTVTLAPKVPVSVSEQVPWLSVPEAQPPQL